LPGDNTTLEVGSGSWHWSVPYQDPDARGPYTVDDLVGEILGESAARNVMMEVLDRVEAPGFLRMVIFDERNIPLRKALHMLPNHEDVVTQMNDALQSIK
jgi:hypothetical protein